MAFRVTLATIENVTLWFAWTYVVALTAAVVHYVVWSGLSLAAWGSVVVVLLQWRCSLQVIIDDLIQCHLRVCQDEVALGG